MVRPDKFLWALSGMAGRACFQGLYFLALAWAMGPKELGSLAVFTAITTMLAPLAGVGCSEVLLKHTATDRTALARTYGHGRMIIPWSGLAIAAAAAAAGWFLLDLARDWPALLCMVLIDVVTLRYLELVLALTQALEDFKANAFIILAVSLGKLAAVAALLALPVPRTVRSWSVIQLLFLAPVTAWLCGRTRRAYIHEPVPNRIDPALAREGVYFALGVTANGAYRDLDKLFLAKAVPAGELGLYATAYRLVEVAYIPLRALLYVILPRLFHPGGRARKHGETVKFIAGSFAIALGAYLVYGAVVQAFPWCFGARFQGIGRMGGILGLMLFGRVLLNYKAALVLTGLGVKYTFVVQSLAALATLVLCWALIPRGGWRAAAWISVGTDFLFAFVYLFLRRREPVAAP
jgi:O-antigen/teichoic acid export membrane protein